MAAIGCLEVEQLHAESAPGQFEIVTGHKDALEVSLRASKILFVTALMGLHSGRQRTALHGSDLLWPPRVLLIPEQGASTHWIISKG